MFPCRCHLSMVSFVAKIVPTGMYRNIVHTSRYNCQVVSGSIDASSLQKKEDQARFHRSLAAVREVLSRKSQGQVAKTYGMIQRAGILLTTRKSHASVKRSAAKKERRNHHDREEQNLPHLPHLPRLLTLITRDVLSQLPKERKTETGKALIRVETRPSVPLFPCRCRLC